MHSMFVHFADADRDEIAEYFDAHAVRGLREHWYHPTRADPAFTIRFPHEGSEFHGDENRRHVLEALGVDPALTVQFDVGGKRPGHKELREFLVRLLAIHSGVALDDLSPHVWSIDDLKSDRHVGGFAFADHESYRKLHTTHHHATHVRKDGQAGQGARPH